jgi:hypothetical protein
VLHIVKGIGCKTGEFIINFELDISQQLQLQNVSSTSSFSLTGADKQNRQKKKKTIPLASIPIHEKLSVLELKTLLFNKWDEFMNPNDNNINLKPETIHHIRIKDGKVFKVYFFCSTPYLYTHIFFSYNVTLISRVQLLLLL